MRLPTSAPDLRDSFALPLPGLCSGPFEFFPVPKRRTSFLASLLHPLVEASKSAWSTQLLVGESCSYIYPYSLPKAPEQAPGPPPQLLFIRRHCLSPCPFFSSTLSVSLRFSSRCVLSLWLHPLPNVYETLYRKHISNVPHVGSRVHLW